MLTSFYLYSSPFVFLFSFSSFTYSHQLYFLSLEVWDLKLTNPKLGDRTQLWPVLFPVTVNYFQKKAPSNIFDWILNTPLLLL